MSSVYPLLWPSQWQRTPLPQRRRANFSTSGPDGLWHLEDQVRMMGGRNLIVSTNLRVARYTDRPVWSGKAPTDPGVAVYFDLAGEEVCFPCDCWDRVADNLRAIGKTVEALRGIERWGAQDMVRAAFTGFAALPDGTGSAWWDVLSIARDSTPTEIDAAYRVAIKASHPDTGGDAEQFHNVQEAYRQARAR